MLLTFTSKLTQPGLWFLADAQSCSPRGSREVKRKEELAPDLQARLGGEGCNLQVGQGRTAALYQFREVQEEKAGLCFSTHVSLESAGTEIVNRRTLLILLPIPGNLLDAARN